MLDPRQLRTDLEALKAGVARRGADPSDLDRAAELDHERRRLGEQRDEIRARINALSKEVGRLRGAGKADEAETAMAESRALGDQERDLAARADEVEAAVLDVLLRVPNVPADDAPDGAGESDNVVLRTVGGQRTWAEHQRVPHWEIGAELGLLDLDRAVKLSGSMFVLYRGDGARLLRALTQLALDRHADAWEEIRPPSLVRSQAMVGAGNLPKFADDAYHLERDDLWAIPTAEVPLTSMHGDEILDGGDLPLRYTAYTPCFRREAGSAGRDTRGLLRSHEFDKVELMAYCTPEQAPDMQAEITDRAERLLVDLGLTYRVVDLCTADLTFSSRRTFDLEAYAPGCDLWLEVSSVSWFGDFQARRANVRYRRAGGKGTAFVHTLNGSALAWPRVWAALVETHRQSDGTICVPDVLQPYLGGRSSLGG